MSEGRRLRRSVLRVGVSALVIALLGAAAGPAGASDELPTRKEWRQDVAEVMTGSRAYVSRVTTKDQGALAVNFDIDNSALASQYRPGHATPAVLSFAKYAKRHGVALLFNTARTGSDVKKARRALTKAGYPVTAICGRKAEETVKHGKQRCRARFIRKGYTIVANVGNRATDFSGPRNYGRAFKLPNYGNRLR